MSASQPVPTTAENVIDDNARKPERSLRETGIRNLTSYGLSPTGAAYFWEFLVNMQSFALSGVVFAALSYFFDDGTYVGIFGLYIAYQIDVLDCILYELIILLPLDVPSLEIFLHMEVTFPYLLVGAFYVLTAIILECFGFSIRLLFRLCSVL